MGGRCSFKARQTKHLSSKRQGMSKPDGDVEEGRSKPKHERGDTWSSGRQRIPKLDSVRKKGETSQSTREETLGAQDGNEFLSLMDVWKEGETGQSKRPGTRSSRRQGILKLDGYLEEERSRPKQRSSLISTFWPKSLTL